MKQQFQPRPVSKSIRTNNLNKTARSSLLANPQQAQQTFKKGKLQQQNQNYQKALQLYIRSTIYDPSYYQSYCNMGSVYRILGRYAQSRSSYLKAIQIKPQDSISHYNLANVLRILGNIEQSIKHYEYIINLKQSSSSSSPPSQSIYLNSLINIGICFKNQELYQKAIEYYQKATKIDSNDQCIIFNHAMIIMLIINRLDGDVFHSVRKQRAAKAEGMFKALLKINPKNQMAQIQLIKIQATLNRSNDVLNQAVVKLKAFLPWTQKKEEVNQALGYVLKLLKEYQASATYYAKSFRNIKQPKNEAATNVYDNQAQHQKAPQNASLKIIKTSDLTQQQGLKLLQDQNIQDLKDRLTTLKDDNLTKHVITMALELYLSQKQGQSHFNKAIDIYNKHFIKNSQEIPYQQLSIQAHKIVGKFLSKQNKYKQSIKHFQFISNKLNSQTQRSKVHSSLGNDYEALGDRQKALKQYKIALEAEPNNYEMIYNVGCCLSQDGQLEQSLKYFNKFLQKIQGQHDINMATKALYKADCLVTMSSCCYNMPNQFQIYEKAFKAIKQMESQSQADIIQFQGSKLLNFYLRLADLLEQKLIKLTNKKSQEYLSCKEDILYAYINLLQNQMCPDRNAILNNCATIYYEQKLFMNCLSNLNQILEPTGQTYNNLALTYLHLGQHFMATQSIYKAYDEDIHDPIIRYNKQIFDWIYSMGNFTLLHSKYPNKSQKSMVYRWQYGILLLDALTKKINQTEDSPSSQEVEKIITQLLQRQNLTALLQELDIIRLKIILPHIQKSQPQQSYFIQQPLLNISLSKSTNLKADLQTILTSNKTTKDRSIVASQLLLHLFVFSNQPHQSTIKNLIQTHHLHKKQQSISFNLDRRITIVQEKIQKEFNIANLNSLIINLCSWQCQLQSNLTVLIRIIQKCYYHYKHTKTLQIQHNFPRHNDYDQCSATLDRIVRIIYPQFNINPPQPNYKAKHIIQMKSQLLNLIETTFNNQFRNQTQVKVSLNQQLVPVTIYGYFQNKNDCVLFIKELKKQSTSKLQVDFLGKNQHEITVFVSNLIKLILRWSDEDAQQDNLVGVMTNPLGLYHQAVIQLSEGVEMLMEGSAKNKEILGNLTAFQ